MSLRGCSGGSVCQALRGSHPAHRSELLNHLDATARLTKGHSHPCLALGCAVPANTRGQAAAGRGRRLMGGIAETLASFKH